MPFSAKSAYASASDMPASRSAFTLRSRYSMPLVLKKRRSGSPLLACHAANSSAVGLSSTICRSTYVTPCASSHAFAFLQVEHFGYSTNSTSAMRFLLGSLPYHVAHHTRSHRCNPRAKPVWRNGLAHPSPLPRRPLRHGVARNAPTPIENERAGLSDL